MGQSRYSLDGRRLRLPGPGSNGAGKFHSLQQPRRHRDGLRYLLAPTVHFRQRGLSRLRYPLLPRQADRAGWRYLRKGQAALGPHVQGHYGHPLQAGGPTATAPTRIRHGRPASAGSDRLRRKNGLYRRRHIPAGGLRLPDRRPCPALPADGGGGCGHQPIDGVVPAQ